MTPKHDKKNISEYPKKKSDSDETRKKAKVLVVDDELFIRKMMKIILTIEGYEVFTASNSNEGLKIAGEFNPDLITTDMSRPGEDGTEFIRELKRNDKTKDIPVIMISSISTDYHRAMECGACAHLLKPFELEELRKKIDEILTGSVNENSFLESLLRKTFTVPVIYINYDSKRDVSGNIIRIINTFSTSSNSQ